MVKHYQEDTIKEVLEAAKKTLSHREIAERMGKNLPEIYFAIRRTFAEGSFGYAGSAVIDRTTWKRIETSSYPGNSLREIILNAFCHTNYFIRSNIKVEFYKDKAKITSQAVCLRRRSRTC